MASHLLLGILLFILYSITPTFAISNTTAPTIEPTLEPIFGWMWTTDDTNPTIQPTAEPTAYPTTSPSSQPTDEPTTEPAQCVASWSFSYSLNAIWSEHDTQYLTRDTYIMSMSDGTPYYLYYLWDDDWAWVMSDTFGSSSSSHIYYKCWKWTLSECTTGVWYGWRWSSFYFSYGYYSDSDASIYVGNCPTTQPTSDPTSDPTQIPSNLPTTIPTVEPTLEPTLSPTSNETVCVVTEDFSVDGVNRIWIQFNDSSYNPSGDLSDDDEYSAFRTAFNRSDIGTLYLFWSSNDSQWIITLHTDFEEDVVDEDILYFCNEDMLSNCTNGTWHLYNISNSTNPTSDYTLDVQATANILFDAECRSLLVTSSPTSLPTVVPTFEPSPAPTFSPTDVPTESPTDFNTTNVPCWRTENVGYTGALDLNWEVFANGSTYNRPAYSAYTSYYSQMLYLHWDSEWWLWTIRAEPDDGDLYGTNRWDDYWYCCSYYDLEECTEGMWWDTTNYNTDSDGFTTMLECGCTDYVETLHFYDDAMNGKWYYMEHKGYYRLNISSGGYYKMEYVTDDDDDGGAWWTVYEVDEDGSVSDRLTFCANGVELKECGGQWFVYDDVFGYGWYPHSEATSQLVECAVRECDVTGYTVNETQC